VLVGTVVEMVGGGVVGLMKAGAEVIAFAVGGDLVGGLKGETGFGEGEFHVLEWGDFCGSFHLGYIKEIIILRMSYRNLLRIYIQLIKK
jgi:hypothetical protein